MKYVISLLLIFACADVYAQAVVQIRSHNQLTATGTVNHTTLDSFYNSKGQASGLASLDASGNVVQSAGTVTLSGGYVKQTNGTATGTQLTSVQINSGTATFSAATIAGVSAPYIAQTSGTGSGNTLTNLKVLTALMIGTTTADVLCEIYGGNIDFERTDSAPLFSFFRNSAVPAAENSLGVIYFYGNNATPAIKEYAAINGVITDKTVGSEDGRIGFWAMVNGSTAERMRLEGANLGIGTTTPTNKLTVVGTIESTSGGVKFPDGNTQTEAVTQVVKGIVAGSGITIDNPTGTVTINASGGTGGWTDGTNTVSVTTPSDQVVIGSTTAASNQILTVVGSQTTTDLNVTNAMSLAFAGTPTIDLAIGDNDTGINQSSDNVIAIVAGGASTLVVDGTTSRVRIGTSTSNTTLHVGGTVTAAGFSGNGAGLTNLPSASVDFSEVTGSPTASQLPLISGLLGSATSAQLPSGAIIASTLVIGSQTAHPNTVLTVVGSGTNLLSVINDTGGIATATTQMTSDTAPAPNVATSSSYYVPETLYSYYAFDNVLGSSSRWYSGDGALPDWLRYDSGANVQKVIIQYSLATQGNVESPKDWTFEGSNNLTNWVVLDTETGIATWTANSFKYYNISSGSQTPFRAHRINISAVQSGNYAEIVEMEFVEGGITKVLFVDNNKNVLVNTDIAYAGTTTSYPFQVAGSSLGNDWTLRPSSSKVKTDLPGSPTTEILDSYRQSDAHKFLYKDKVVEDAVVAIKALNDYIAEDEKTEYELYEEVYQNNYIEGEVGSQSVNAHKMKKDFSLIHTNNKTAEWDDIKIVTDKADRIKRTKAYLEMDGGELRNNTANYGVEIDRNCPPQILDSNGLPSASKWLGANYTAILGLIELVDEMKLELGSTTAEIKQLKAIVNP